MSSSVRIGIIAWVTSIPQPICTSSWMLDPDITYLNHASFGARTVEVYEAQQRYKRQFEASPVNFLDRNRHLIENARETVAHFVGADIDGFGFVENATTGVGCVIQSLNINEGDEIVTTDHVYNGVRQLLQHHAAKHSLRYTEVSIPLPLVNNQDILNRIAAAITSHTKLLVVDHVASASSIVFPIQQIVQLCREKGVLVLVDGAHAPGMLALDVLAVDADWYVGNLHKWVCAPVGAGFLWANESKRASTHPMTISHWLNQGFTKEFDWQGTRDVSSWLAAADAVRWGESIGWDNIRDHNHKFVTWMHESLVTDWDVEPLSPIDGRMLGSMATVVLPSGGPQSMEDCLALRDVFYEKYSLEVPIFEFQGKGVLRVSAQLYAREEHVDALKLAIKQQNFKSKAN